MITRICLIDDDVVVLDATALGLREAGYAVLTAPGAAAGLDLIQRDGADVIVTDMNMPGASGGELIVQARASWPDMPIIAISGANTAGVQTMLDAARALGADALLSKPFRVAQLKDVIDRVLAEKMAARRGPAGACAPLTPTGV